MKKVFLISSVMTPAIHSDSYKVYYARLDDSHAFEWYQRPERATVFDNYLQAYSELGNMAVKEVYYQIEEFYLKEQ